MLASAVKNWPQWGKLSDAENAYVIFFQKAEPHFIYLPLETCLCSSVGGNSSLALNTLYMCVCVCVCVVQA